MMMKMNKLFIPCVIVLCVSCGSSQDYLRDIPRSKRKALVVLNFKNNTPKSRALEYQPWEFGLASMVMTDIEAIGMFNIIGKERLKDVVKEQEFQLSGMVNPDDITRLGKLTGANYILTGSFMEMSGQLRLESQVFSVEKGAQLGTASVTGQTGSFFDLEKRLVVKTTEYLDAMLTSQEQMQITKKVETKSVAASLSNYRGELAVMEAEELKGRGKEEEAKRYIQEAKQSFEKAIQIDPEYEKAKKNLSKISLAIPVTL